MEMQEQDLLRNKSILLNTLKSFVTICEENNLRYFVAYGTLIGAVRHHGFIPWDDDIDVWMFREDYNKFVEIVKKKKDGMYEIVDIDTPKYFLPFAKFCDAQTTIVEFERVPCVHGVYIDIFILDYTEMSKESFLSKKKHYDCLTDMFLKSSVERHLKDLLIDLKDSQLQKIFWHLAQITILRCIRPVIKYSLKHYFRKEEKSNHLMCAEGGFGNDYFDSSWFAKAIQVPFESLNVNIPIGYDSYLKQAYGDYMTPPPIEERFPHHSHYYFNFERRVPMGEIKRIVNE